MGRVNGTKATPRPNQAVGAEGGRPAPHAAPTAQAQSEQARPGPRHQLRGEQVEGSRAQARRDLGRHVAAELKRAAEDGNVSSREVRRLEQRTVSDGVSASELKAVRAFRSSDRAKELDAKSAALLRDMEARLTARADGTAAAKPGTAAPHDANAQARRDILNTIEQGDLPSTAAGYAIASGLTPAEPRPFRLQDPVDGTNTSWDSAGNTRVGIPAQIHKLDIDGRTIDIVVEQPPDAKQYTAAEISEALAQLPTERLANIHRVELINTGFGYYMDVNASRESGTLQVYPTRTKPSIDTATQSMTHEIGHLLTTGGGALGDGPERWADYGRAVDADGRPVSGFVQELASPTSRQKEDFAEFFNLREMFRGTPEEAQLRALFPHRFAFLESIGI